MKKINKFIIFISIFFILTIPILSLAADWPGLVKCGKTEGSECGFKDLITLVNDVVKFVFVYLAVPIAAIMFVYAGFQMITAGGESAHSREKAKHIFTNAVIGLVLAAGAWLIIHTLLLILGYQDAGWIGF